MMTVVTQLSPPFAEPGRMKVPHTVTDCGFEAPLGLKMVVKNAMTAPVGKWSEVAPVEGNHEKAFTKMSWHTPAAMNSETPDPMPQPFWSISSRRMMRIPAPNNCRKIATCAEKGIAPAPDVGPKAPPAK